MEKDLADSYLYTRDAVLTWPVRARPAWRTVAGTAPRCPCRCWPPSSSAAAAGAPALPGLARDDSYPWNNEHTLRISFKADFKISMVYIVSSFLISEQFRSCFSSTQKNNVVSPSISSQSWSLGDEGCYVCGAKSPAFFNPFHLKFGESPFWESCASHSVLLLAVVGCRW